MNTKKWISIGTVLGETNIDHFYFSLKNYKAKKGDIITTESKIPSSEGNVVPVTVWGKISSIESSNAFFPTEAAQELTNEGIDIRDTILPSTRDELICKVIILGFTLKDNLKLMPLNYPVCPASAVSYPSSEDVEALLISDLDSEHPLFIGSLLARDAVKIRIDADNLVSRHVSIFGMSGSGKTVMVRRIMDELLRKKYQKLLIAKFLLILKKLKRAEYSLINIGHYGLAFDHYVHFTSPIRRYADLVCHRSVSYTHLTLPTKA
mgnify:CR=1 FL=1